MGVTGTRSGPSCRVSTRSGPSWQGYQGVSREYSTERVDLGRHDWFRNKEWDATIEADFEAHLRRARDKVRPLKIQGSMLTDTHPEVALRLIDRCLRFGDHFFVADAYESQARAPVRMGDIIG